MAIKTTLQLLNIYQRVRLVAFCKTIFHFLRMKNISCKVITSEKAVNLVDGLGMSIPYELIFKRQSEFVDILEQDLCRHE